jgi:molybdopterin molybdotransferase
MAGLQDDCFRIGDELMPFEDGLRILKERARIVVGTETVTLNDALGRVLAEDITAPRDVPPHDNSAVDGYAVAFSDLNTGGETRLPVTARIAAGHPLERSAQQGEAVRIFTGASVPDGMDTVFMQEDSVLDGDDVVLPSGIKQGANRRKQGEDVVRATLSSRPDRCFVHKKLALRLRSAWGSSKSTHDCGARCFPPVMRLQTRYPAPQAKAQFMTPTVTPSVRC